MAKEENREAKLDKEESERGSEERGKVGKRCFGNEYALESGKGRRIQQIIH